MKRIIRFSIFLLLSIIVWWSITEYSDDDYRLQQASGTRYIEIFMDAFELTSMDDEGRPDYTLNGSYLQKFNDSDVTEIKKPVIHFLQQKGQWTISADFATIDNNTDIIQLETNVVMAQKNTEPAITFRTQNLQIDTKAQIARTDAPVEITQGISRIKSIGMTFDNMSQQLVLSADVNGYFLADERGQ
ncbi:MAG TPA: LPS export ABC transporter periplasmic protein LptC [Gammaproteobacteria bacterium]|nr:LPS export ABC transporter periplasmic protein LptC [Gammaproteobacteria bacterium]